jgi:L,D-transpeptidase YbiS
LVLLFQALRVCAVFAALTRSAHTLDDRTGRLNILTRDYRRQLDYGRELSVRMAFLQDLPNLLPEQTRFVRTQNVIQEEVGALRRRIGARLARATYVLVDTKANKLYVKKGLKLLLEANCSVGRGGLLRDKATGRGWDFNTPKGVFAVVWKTENPVWIKPDWAFVEAKQPIPPPDDPARLVEGELGGYLLSIGNGYLIHGTKDEESLGRPVSHGCVRLGALDLEQVYKTVPIGARVYVY